MVAAGGDTGADIIISEKNRFSKTFKQIFYATNLATQYREEQSEDTVSC